MQRAEQAEKRMQQECEGEKRRDPVRWSGGRGYGWLQARQASLQIDKRWGKGGNSASRGERASRRDQAEEEALD